MNLMCPARLILLPVGSAAELTGQRVATVYAGTAGVGPAELIAHRLAAPLRILPELAEVPGESDQDAVRRSDAALGGIADLHRGETVVVVTPGLSLGLDLGAEPVELEHDGRTWTVVPDPNAVTAMPPGPGPKVGSRVPSAL